MTPSSVPLLKRQLEVADGRVVSCHIEVSMQLAHGPASWQATLHVPKQAACLLSSTQQGELEQALNWVEWELRTNYGIEPEQLYVQSSPWAGPGWSAPGRTWQVHAVRDHGLISFASLQEPTPR